MKKTNKIIALVLAMVLAFSSVPLMASASAIKDDVTTVEKLIQPDSLGSLVEWLLKSINNRKEEVTGSVLRLVFMLVEDEDLQKAIGSTDLTKATDEELATILVTWLDSYVLANLDIDKNVKNILGIFGIKIGSVNQLIDSLYSVANTLKVGELKLNAAALKNVDTGKNKNLNAVYALLQFLSDNTSVIKEAVKGDLSFGFIIDNALKLANFDLNKEITNVIGPDAIKEMLCDALSLDYNAYKNYTTDELVAVAFLQLLTGTDSVSKADAGKVMNLTIYGLLETYAGDIYANLLLDLLNNDAKNALKDLAAKDTTGTLAKVINLDFEFKADTFDAYLGAGKGNMVAQLNNAVITLLEVIIKPAELKKIGLEKGGNDKLNGNLTKTFRYILPLIKDLPDLGVDLSGFTAAKVKNMSSEEMAVAVLKLFFEGWFENANMKEVNSAKTLEQLGVLAAKYAVTNKDWVPVNITAATKAANVTTLSDAACIDLIFEIGMETAAKSLDYNKSTTYYELPANTSKWTGADYLDDIVDWALNLVDGLPAAADSLTTVRGTTDGNGGFYKLNVILDSLIDLSFISGCGNNSFKFDIETMLMDKLLGNLLNFDLEASVAILAQNENASLFGKKVNVAAIDLVDDLLTGLFEYDAYTLGDVDNDGKVTASDARLALRASVNLEKLTATQTKAADIDKSSTVTASDARMILRASVGLEKF